MNVVIDTAALSRRLDEVAAIPESPAPAVTRVLFSEADLRARDYVRHCAREAGLMLREDAAGNIFLRWAGSDPSLPAVAAGSHTDAPLLPNAPQRDTIHGSKAVGEPPLMLAISVREAIRVAVAAFGNGGEVRLASPAAGETVFAAIRDRQTSSGALP